VQIDTHKMDDIIERLATTCSIYNQPSNGEIFIESMKRLAIVSQENLRSELIVAKRRYELLCEYVSHGHMMEESDKIFAEKVINFIKAWDDLDDEQRLAIIKDLDRIIIEEYMY